MKLKSLIPAIASLAIAACANLAPPAAAPTPGGDRALLIAQGRELAETHCRACHAVGETGESPFAEAPPFRTLAERYPVTMLEEAFAEGILVGHPAMPEFRLEPPQIDALVAYLESIQERRGG